MPKTLKEMLKHVTIFAGIRDDAFDRFFKVGDIITKPAGEVLIKEGTQAEEIYIVLEGNLKVILNLEEEPLELLEVKPGKIIGETSVIGIQQHSASVVTITDSKLFILSRKTLMLIHEEDPELFSHLILNIARELARRLYASNQVILKFQKQLKGNWSKTTV